jgi:type VI secretion system secreted protein Hcp
MAFYLQIPGIKGAATDSQHKDWIAVHNVNFQVDQKVSVRPGHVDNRFGSIPAISDFTFTKLADVASPKVLEASLGGMVYDKVVMHVCDSDSKSYIEYTLHKAIVSGYDLEGVDAVDGAHTRLQETFTINAVKIEMRYLVKNGAAMSAGYDLEKAALA